LFEIYLKFSICQVLCLASDTQSEVSRIFLPVPSRQCQDGAHTLPRPLLYFSVLIRQ